MTDTPVEPDETTSETGVADATEVTETAATGVADEAEPSAAPGAAAPEATEAGVPQAAAAADSSADPDAGRLNRRKVREGLVLSIAMDKTAVVGVIDRVRHPRYAKTVQRTKRLYAHDENNDLRVGDRVRLAEMRPMSKLKRWRVVDVLERAK